MTAKFELQSDYINDEEPSNEIDDSDNEELLKMLYAQSMHIEANLIGNKETISNKKAPSMKTRHINMRINSNDYYYDSNDFYETRNQTWKIQERNKRCLDAKTSLDTKFQAIEKENKRDSLSLINMSKKKPMKTKFDKKYSTFKQNRGDNKVTHLTFENLVTGEKAKPMDSSQFYKPKTTINYRFDIGKRLNAFDAIRFRF